MNVKSQLLIYEYIISFKIKVFIYESIPKVQLLQKNANTDHEWFF